MAPGRAAPPSTWREEAAKVSDTVRFAYSETLGKWPIMDLAFGIKYLASRQECEAVASIFACSNCLQLKGLELMTELIHHLRLLKLCISFSKKSFPTFLEYGGYSHEDILLQECKAGFLKPAFTILRDSDSKSFLVIIRGMHSMNDTLTAATGYVVPFHYLVLHEGGVTKLVLGYAHFGMVAAARWIAKCATPCLIKATYEYPTYSIKIVGNSLGGGIASLLTYILRERMEFSTSTCVVFSPASCMTWDLAESSKDFITTIINGSDIVPSCSLASLDNLRAEVRASSWMREVLNKRPRFLNFVKHSIHALGSCLPFISCSRTVHSKPQAMKSRERNGAKTKRKTGSCCSCCSCMGAHGCAIRICAIPNDCCQSRTAAEELDFGCSTSGDKCTTENMVKFHASGGPMEGDVSEVKLRVELERGEAAVKGAEEKREHHSASGVLDRHYFFPPGTIMHMVVTPASENGQCGSAASEQSVGIYETRRELYGKIRLSPNMIADHYMTLCEKTMELLIDELKKDAYSFTDV